MLNRTALRGSMWHPLRMTACTALLPLLPVELSNICVLSAFLLYSLQPGRACCTGASERPVASMHSGVLAARALPLHTPLVCFFVWIHARAPFVQFIRAEHVSLRLTCSLAPMNRELQRDPVGK